VNLWDRPDRILPKKIVWILKNVARDAVLGSDIPSSDILDGAVVK
jgi:hypothetical protein